MKLQTENPAKLVVADEHGVAISTVTGWVKDSNSIFLIVKIPNQIKLNNLIISIRYCRKSSFIIL